VFAELVRRTVQQKGPGFTLCDIELPVKVGG
jgi:hypothetical protein